MQNNQAVFKEIFNRDLSDPATVHYLAQLTGKYPYFTPAQFYLLLQTSPESGSYKKRAAKTGFLFNNPHWLNFQLQQTMSPAAINLQSQPAKIIVDENEPTLVESAESLSEEIATRVILDTPSDIATENIVSEREPLPVEENTGYENMVSLAEMVLQPADEDNLTLDPTETYPAVENEISKEEILMVSTDNNIDQLEQINEVETHNDNDIAAETVIAKTTNIELDEDTDNEEDEMSEAYAPVALVENRLSEMLHGLHAAPESSIENEINDTEDTGQPPAEDELEPMHITLNLKDEKAGIDENMLFEPMHVVDYFASQGIKVTDEADAADKLSTQLKSFTDWLKTMKKIHVENNTETSAASDLTVQQLADKSNNEQEVITEAMAEVFARQGKIKKAREVYQKLSLLNPAKSAYFANKIENLKVS